MLKVVSAPRETLNEVVVGNVGTVYRGEDDAAARNTYVEMRDQSLRGYGRAAGESVVWLRDGEPYAEHEGTVED